VETKETTRGGNLRTLDLLYRPNPGCQPPSNPRREIFHKVPRAVMQANCHVSAAAAKPDLCSHTCPVRAPVTLSTFPRADVSRFDPIDRARIFVP